MNIIEKGLEARAAKELEETRQARIKLDTSVIELISVVGALQLALRHPVFKGLSSIQVVGFIETAKKHLQGQPAILEVIERGFDSRFDYEVFTEE